MLILISVYVKEIIEILYIRGIQSGAIRHPIRERIQNVRFTSKSESTESPLGRRFSETLNRDSELAGLTVTLTSACASESSDGMDRRCRVADCKRGFSKCIDHSQQKSNLNPFLNPLMNRPTLNSPIANDDA
jgi:hypothetical protein